MSESNLIKVPESRTSGSVNSQQRDRSLLELQTGRNLQKVVGSIERFLLNQIDRLEHALQEGQRIAEQGEVVQRLVMDLEKQRETWEQERRQELDQLANASEQLIQGWQDLEAEKRAWLAERENAPVSRPATSSANANLLAESSSANAATAFQDTAPDSPEPAAMTQQSQWEQMQREMQMHASKKSVTK